MADHTGIQWTDATWNPVTGCTKVSSGCKNCYAKHQTWPRLSAMPNTIYTGRDFEQVQCHRERLDQPYHWKKPRRIFVNSMSDLFHDDVPESFVQAVFTTMATARQHQFQVLTKRPQRMLALLQRWKRNGATLRSGHGVTLPNVWLGVSIEDQETADERIPLLLKTPAFMPWVSAEPLLGPVDITPYLSPLDESALKWVVVGGESGPNARPMHPDWVKGLRDQCAKERIPFFFKQWGSWSPRSACYHTLTCGQAAADIDPDATRWPCIRLTFAGNDGQQLGNADDGDDVYMQKVGRNLSGRALQGVTYDQYPTWSTSK
ncbi:DUF5131 family protein [Parachitinimonas caeni]|uniref:Phage Gp37/Gp68 family protein n=1 Tax=Parachitinimonas caeni TaxID=3031301 RepID=A0ABT7E2C0_9NEIS|nr:phage Gp37/Gp68 family protein [Parachitinimonas caeni]MDK2126468.1 phage Gp37/Gp68 family protein [Parachitinimonas caeni]